MQIKYKIIIIWGGGKCFESFWPFSLGRKKMACSASLPQVVLFNSEDKLSDYTTILVKIQEQVERKIKNSLPQGRKFTSDPNS